MTGFCRVPSAKLKRQPVCPFGVVRFLVRDRNWHYRNIAPPRPVRPTGLVAHLVLQAGVLSHLRSNLFLFACVLQTRFCKVHKQSNNRELRSVCDHVTVNVSSLRYDGDLNRRLSFLSCCSEMLVLCEIFFFYVEAVLGKNVLLIFEY